MRESVNSHMTLPATAVSLLQLDGSVTSIA
jgi:hypothetical protein